jgi:hypothetical protein
MKRPATGPGPLRTARGAGRAAGFRDLLEAADLPDFPDDGLRDVPPRLCEAGLRRVLPE